MDGQVFGYFILFGGTFFILFSSRPLKEYQVKKKSIFRYLKQFIYIRKKIRLLKYFFVFINSYLFVYLKSLIYMYMFVHFNFCKSQ